MKNIERFNPMMHHLMNNKILKRINSSSTIIDLHNGRDTKLTFNTGTNQPGGLVIFDNGEYNRVCMFFNNCHFSLNPIGINKPGDFVLLPNSVGVTLNTRGKSIEDAVEVFNNNNSHLDPVFSASKFRITEIIHMTK